MIQILTVKDSMTRARLCQKAGLDNSNEYHIIAIHNEQGIVTEGAIFKYEGDHGEIFWLDMGEDIELTEGLARAVLSIMEIRGVKSVTLPSCYEILAKKLGFKFIEDHFEVNLDGYFCCSCQHK